MICSVSMEPFATSRRELARVQKVGQVPIAAKELVTINFTALDALKSARALPTTPNCKKLVWCLGRTSLYPIFSYDHVRCHPWTGECICKEGWDGQTCSRPCPTYTFGLGCRNVCTCKNDAHCDPVNGTCVCLSGIDPPPSLVRSIIVLASILFLFFPFRSINNNRLHRQRLPGFLSRGVLRTQLYQRLRLWKRRQLLKYGRTMQMSCRMVRSLVWISVQGRLLRGELQGAMSL